VVELMAGITIDPHFGPVVLAGLGGIFVELLKDVSVRLPPIHEEDAREMLYELRAAPLLGAARGRPAADVEAAVAVLCRLGELALDLGDRITELDVNPLFVLAQGRGALAGDALVVLR
jgi:acyl-CoA synthetase (NDP forming)